MFRSSRSPPPFAAILEPVEPRRLRTSIDLDGGASRELLRGEGGRDLFHAADGYGDRVLGGWRGEGDRGYFDRKDRYPDIESLIAWTAPRPPVRDRDESQ